MIGIKKKKLSSFIIGTHIQNKDIKYDESIVLQTEGTGYGAYKKHLPN